MSSTEECDVPINVSFLALHAAAIARQVSQIACKCIHGAVPD
jgi:hypothetical protein